MELELPNLFAAVITILLGVIGFFLRNIHNDFKALKEDFSDYRVDLSRITTRADDFKIKQEEFNTNTTQRLNKHSERLELQQQDITALKVKVK